MSGEKNILIGQVDDALADGIEDTEDALELAILVGLARRLGASGAELIEAKIWHESFGEQMLSEVWQHTVLSDYTDAIDALLTGEAGDDAIKEALFSWDELVAAAIWSGHEAHLQAHSAEVASTIRQAPQTFAPLANYAAALLTLPALREHLPLYDFWSAVAEAQA